MADHDDLRARLHDASIEAWRLSYLAGGLDALHCALPSSVHPDAGPMQLRAAEALAELITVMIERTEALALRLERMGTAAGKAE